MSRAGLALWLGILCACGVSPTVSEKREIPQLESQLQTLETRLLWSQSRVHYWRELAQRHRQVSEVACHNQSAHLQQMARFFEKENAKALKKRKNSFHVQGAFSKKKR